MSPSAARACHRTGWSPTRRKKLLRFFARHFARHSQPLPLCLHLQPASTHRQAVRRKILLGGQDGRRPTICQGRENSDVGTSTSFVWTDGTARRCPHSVEEKPIEWRGTHQAGEIFRATVAHIMDPIGALHHRAHPILAHEGKGRVEAAKDCVRCISRDRKLRCWPLCLAQECCEPEGCGGRR